MRSAIIRWARAERLTLCLLALLATGGSEWINPAPEAGSAETAQAPQLAAIPPESDETAPPLHVVNWGFSDTQPGSHNGISAAATVAGRPVYLWMTIDGGQAAVDRMTAEGRLAILVHWNRDAVAGSAGAPDLTTELTVGRPELTPVFAQKVRTDGYFEWHSWARKDTLSPGRWTVSLTYPDGEPVLCGTPPGGACRLSIDVGASTG